MNTTGMCMAKDYATSHTALGMSHDDSYDTLLMMFGITTIGSLLVWLLTLVCNVDIRIRMHVSKDGLPPLDVKNEYYDTPHRVYGGAKVKHRVILVRHGESMHNKRHDGRDGEALGARPSLDTELTDDGLTQAEDVGRFLTEFDWHPDVVRVSPMLRARQTAEPFLRRWFCKHALATVNNQTPQEGVMIETTRGYKTRFVPDRMCMEVNTWEDQELHLEGLTTKKETYREFVERVIRWKKALEEDSVAGEGERMQTIAFTHSMVIGEFLNSLVSENRESVDDNGVWSKVYWQVNHGSITCADYMDNGEWNIHAMNYTKHISRFTGLKSPLV